MKGKLKRAYDALEELESALIDLEICDADMKDAFRMYKILIRSAEIVLSEESDERAQAYLDEKARQEGDGE